MGTERFSKSTNYTENTASLSGGGIGEITVSSGIAKFGKNSSNNSLNIQNTNCSNGSSIALEIKESEKSDSRGLAENLKKIPDTVPHLPIHVDENDVIQGAKELLSMIRPQWNMNHVQFKKFTDGITNKLVGCFYALPNVGNGHTSNISQNTNGTTNASSTLNGGCYHYYDHNDSGNPSDRTDDTVNISNVVLVRVYGNKTDLLIDRKVETRNIKLMHAYGFAPSLYATFNNGIAYDYVPGVTLNTESVLQPEIWILVARRMAEMHRLINAPNCAKQEDIVPMLWKKTQSFFDLVPEHFSNADKHKRLAGTFLPINRLRKEFNVLYKRLESLGSPLVFAHNDLLLGNVIYTESQQCVSFIDYEYADYNFQAFDIGNHFAEFAGVDEVDYSRYPKREFQLKWLQTYLTTYQGGRSPTPKEIERLYVQVNQFTLAAHFFWTIWSLIQAEHSTIDFDYVTYAFIRYNEYLARKDELLSLNVLDPN